MTREEFIGRWRARRDELARLGAHVDAAKLLGEVLGDVEELFRCEISASCGPRPGWRGH